MIQMFIAGMGACFLLMGISAGCNQDQDKCQLSPVIAVKDCTLSDSGTSCLLILKNGRWAYGSEVVVGAQICTKDMKGI